MTRFRSILIILSTLISGISQANQIDFSATIDRQDIAIDESVSLKLNVEVEGGNASLSDPSFSSPDFDILNTFQSTYMDSYYRNGKFGMRNSKRMTYIMRPKKTGALSISNIQITANGKVFTAPNLTINVAESGGRGYAPPSRNAPRGGQLGRNQPRSRSGRGKNFFLRAEVDRKRVYQGQQVVVGYYAYRQTRVSNQEVSKFPTLEGFLREDLDMPIITRKMQPEKVVLGGEEYLRELLAKYAAYPLRTGELEIDPMRMKALYYSRGNNNSPFGDDPFFQFFNTLTPQVTEEESQPIKIEVLPLPEEGKLPSFSGGVGHFDVVATVDRTDGKAHEPITFVVQVSGQGNVSGITLPKLELPNGVEIFETSSETKRSSSGRNTKIFKTLLIPRNAGSLELPPVRFQFFDPDAEQYVMRDTQPISVNIAPGAPGMNIAVNEPTPTAEKKEKVILDLKPLLPYSDTKVSLGQEIKNVSKYAFWICALFIFGAIGVVLLQRFKLLDFLVAPKAALAAVKAPKGAVEKADRLLKEFTSSDEQLDRSYQKLFDLIIQEISDRFEIGARSYSRDVLRTKLVNAGKLSPELWTEVSSVLERAEMAQFAGGAVSSGRKEQFRSDVEKTKQVFRSIGA